MINEYGRNFVLVSPPIYSTNFYLNLQMIIKIIIYLFKIIYNILNAVIIKFSVILWNCSQKIVDFLVVLLSYNWFTITPAMEAWNKYNKILSEANPNDPYDRFRIMVARKEYMEYYAGVQANKDHIWNMLIDPNNLLLVIYCAMLVGFFFIVYYDNKNVMDSDRSSRIEEKLSQTCNQEYDKWLNDEWLQRELFWDNFTRNQSIELNYLNNTYLELFNSLYFSCSF